MNAVTWSLVLAVFVACIVEMVEATTIVMAMGFTRGWKSAIAGTVVALVALSIFTALAGYALANWLPEAALQLVIGTLLLIFGLQWLRKAIYRSSGRKALHDEEKIYQEEVAAAKAAGESKSGIDMFGFMVSFKGVFLEGLEVVFIVLTFGLSADNIPAAAYGAAAAVVLVLILGIIARKPLSMIPENTLKFGVGLLLTSFGIFWSIEGLGIFRDGSHSLEFPGADLAILYFLALVIVLCWALIKILRKPSASAPPTAPTDPAQAEEVVR
ncbi:COG4280 domain-containing protein [Nakamurella lactea]|uniref:COG4280 domain-containing protein n=1 Tax=Nakamurella lactea TaxID=459515 RepID=UPI000424ABC2|nr:TMEM165/GDT1 family protein [Nakamurella lactea]